MSPISNIQTLWQSLREEIESLFPRDVYEAWFQPLTQLSDPESVDVLVLGAPNDFSAIWLEDNYVDLLAERASRIADRPVTIRIEVAIEAPADEKKQSPVRLPLTNNRHQDRGFGARDTISASTRPKRQALNLNPKYSFENFIVGPSNQLAHAASLAVGNSPGTSYNPLFLYGDNGLGKTHLIQAVAHCIHTQNPNANVVYVSCERFTNEFLTAIRDNTLDRFRRFYRSVDTLLIDDIHFLEGKERTQEEFFHTFNELFESQKQLCLTSDCPASEIGKLENRLVSRFQWGMVADIQAPDLETRTAIISKKARALNYQIPSEILSFLAQKVTRNVRRMEGALTKVATYYSLVHKTPDIQTVEHLVQDILQEEAQNQITIEKIQKKVTEYYDIRMADMISKRRPSNIAFPRQVAMYLARILTNHPLKEIGDGFGGRDHGTVIHACKTIENLMEQDESIRRSIDYLNHQLSHSS
jgi:chromosomal replication initiator protein